MAVRPSSNAGAMKLVLCTADGVPIETVYYVSKTMVATGNMSAEERAFVVGRVLAAVANQRETKT
jgi:hypothetical protein